MKQNKLIKWQHKLDNIFIIFLTIEKNVLSYLHLRQERKLLNN